MLQEVSMYLSCRLYIDTWLITSGQAMWEDSVFLFSVLNNAVMCVSLLLYKSCNMYIYIYIVYSTTPYVGSFDKKMLNSIMSGMY